jgi:Ni,Fe-hydrogenase I small subunit
MTNVLWLQGGACSGNTMSFLNAEEPTVCDLIADFGIKVLWHPSLGIELGDRLQTLLRDCISGKIPLDILVFEGSVVNAPNGTGEWNRFADRPMKDWLSDLAQATSFIVAVGDCATWGGIPAMSPNPSESQGLQFLKRQEGGFLGKDFVTKSGLPVINIPGCPAHPDWITQILVAIATGRIADIALDDLHRPPNFLQHIHPNRLYPQRPLCLQSIHRRIWSTQRLSILRHRLSRPHDPFLMQPHPVEPGLLQNPRRYALFRLYRTRISLLRPRTRNRL